MKPMNFVLAGLLMCGIGGTLVFGHFSIEPLWFTWIVGPTLAYLGFAFTCFGTITLMLRPAPKKETSSVAVQQPAHKPAVRIANPAPSLAVPAASEDGYWSVL